MLATAVVHAVIVAVSGSVSLPADTIHNLSDALTAVPLWIAFVLSRRVATRGCTYGCNRTEDLASRFIVPTIALSAVIAAWEAIDRMIHPRAMENIGSAALVADGIEARTGGFTSLAVVTGSAASSREHHRGEETVPVPPITEEKWVLYGCIVGRPIETGILRADGSSATIAR